MQKNIAIEGMTCGNCVKHTTEALEKVAGVTSVSVDLATNSATLEAKADIGDDAIKQAVTDAGYTVTSIS